MVDTRASKVSTLLEILDGMPGKNEIQRIGTTFQPFLRFYLVHLYILPGTLL